MTPWQPFGVCCRIVELEVSCERCGPCSRVCSCCAKGFLTSGRDSGGLQRAHCSFLFWNAFVSLTASLESAAGAERGPGVLGSQQGSCQLGVGLSHGTAEPICDLCAVSSSDLGYEEKPGLGCVALEWISAPSSGAQSSVSHPSTACSHTLLLL